MFFVAETQQNGRELWKSDGTENGTVQVKDILPGPVSSNPYNLRANHGSLYFTATDGNGTELWKSDGTGNGTVQLLDIYPGLRSGNPHLPNSSYPRILTFFGDTLFLSANDAEGTELWTIEDSNN